MNQHSALSQEDLDRLTRSTFLREVRYHTRLASTNTHALELLSVDRTVTCPSLIYAEEQTTGRGRGANRWWSNPGGLTFSLVLEIAPAGLTTEQTPLVSLLTGLSVMKACQTELPRADFSVKWPNDVYLSHRKLAGILVEVPPGRADMLVIGIGINVNNSFRDASPEIRNTAISLSEVGGREYDSLSLLERLLVSFEELLSELARGENVIEKNWPPHCLLTGKQTTLKSGPRLVTGLCLGVDARGALRLHTSRGEERFFGGTVESWSNCQGR
ncbi:MAG TPA: biotin--[acetyl-CoA-carboxylase] ligase [Planctomycetaceae bacterium]|nr:biotin--[acetyl-CoA-carboxylase] ligase [Planctomycetaceae bacterium]